MKVKSLLKNRHAGELGWKVSHSGGIFFSCKRGMKSTSLRWDASSRWGVSSHINSPLDPLDSVKNLVMIFT